MAQLNANFRQAYKIVNKEVLQWFPGHMEKGIKQMQQKLMSVDCIIEVHDARIPFSGRNPTFKSTLYGIKPHMLVLNKKDLTDSSQNHRVLTRLKTEGYSDVVYTNCKDDRCPGVKTIFPIMENLIQNSNRYHRQQEKQYNIMIIGVPNVGKSSLINTFRNRYLGKRSAAPVGGIAGITRSVQNKIKILENPPVYMFDTPGILTPNIPNVECGLKLALCAALPDHLVGEDIIADYLLYWLNKHQKFDYVKLFGLEEPCDDISMVLAKGAIHLNRYTKIKLSGNAKKLYPDFIYAAKVMNKAFRSGELGKIFLDRDVLNDNNKV